ncbi:uncharacterized protein LOC117653658 [Thrips palmi]|uniref:Uncharacterized protein LOC117653658 n=1 Tax=Thrips palmi TaxID=161013 RepID=A0A6P9ACY4_THRPL|nr:uncharacterized protein LOC117653658 [Thrips palmi]
MRNEACIQLPLSSMDIDVQTLLPLTSLVYLLSDQEVDRDSLADLTEGMLIQLVPLCGPRARFIRELAKMKESPTPSAETPRSPPSSRPVSPPPSRPASPRCFSPSQNIDEDENSVDDLDNSPTESSITWADLQKSSNRNSVVRALLNRKSDADRILANYPASKKKYRVRKGLKKEKTYVGLDLVHQKLLCDLLVKEACREPASIGCVTDTVQKLVEEIVAIFPRERKSQYYVPFRCIKLDGKVVKRSNTKGRLYHKFTNYLKVLRDEYVTTDSRVECHIHSTTPETSADVEASLQWLAKRVAICPRLKAEWEVTREARFNSLRNRVDGRNENFVHTYIHSLYPCLAQPDGYLLLLSDFDATFPEKRNSLFMQWPKFSESVKKLANCSDSDCSDAEVFHLLGTLFEEEGLFSIPVTRKYRAGKKEMLNSFLMAVETVDEIDRDIAAYEAKAFQEKFTVQPYAVAVGPWPNPSQFYVSYGGILKQVACVKDAIDVTFKIFHALHANYPRTSECYWMLLQKIVYEIDTVWDSASPEVESLISKLVELRS